MITMAVLNKCPLEVQCLGQYSEVYRVLKNGRISKQRIRKVDNGSIECSIISCSNDSCTFVTDAYWETEDYNIINGQDNRLYIEMK